MPLPIFAPDKPYTPLNYGKNPENLCIPQSFAAGQSVVPFGYTSVQEVSSESHHELWQKFVWAHALESASYLSYSPKQQVNILSVAPAPNLSKTSPADYRRVLQFCEALSNLCEFIDDEWSQVIAKPSLLEFLQKRLGSVLVSMKKSWNITNCWKAQISGQPGSAPWDPSVDFSDAEKAIQAYSALRNTTFKLYSAMIPTIEDIFREPDTRSQ